MDLRRGRSIVRREDPNSLRLVQIEKLMEAVVSLLVRSEPLLMSEYVPGLAKAFIPLDEPLRDVANKSHGQLTKRLVDERQVVNIHSWERLVFFHLPRRKPRLPHPLLVSGASLVFGFAWRQ